MNINESEFPPELEKATSLLIKTGKEGDILVILSKIIDLLKFYYNELCKGNNKELHDKYTQNLYRLNEMKPFLDKLNTPFAGRIIGVNNIGQLMIKVKEKIRLFSMKEVKFGS